MNWSMHDLACAAEVSLSSVRRVELGGGETTSRLTLQKICEAFEVEGIEFLCRPNGRGVFLNAGDLRPDDLFKVHDILKPK